jgi:serine/threonine protein kinase
MDLIVNSGVKNDMQIIIEQHAVHDPEDYAPILRSRGIKFKRTAYYLEVGEPGVTEGWILEASAIQTNLSDLISIIVPLLIAEDVPFKIPTSARKGRAIISGDIGSFILGKVICIYPHSEWHAVELARKLIMITRTLKGPKIPTDRCLGGVIYARYGDKQSIPFKLPDGIPWPFYEFASPKEPRPDTVLQGRFKPISILKEDSKGAVKKGLLLNRRFQIRWCVIKEGRRNMISDLAGRDMVDRLRWQYELHKDLEGMVPLPKVYDFFEENGDGYLVMEHIRGGSLLGKIDACFGERAWSFLALSERIALLDYALQVMEIVATMHKSGYVHRDITCTNFLVDKSDRLWMIDLELSFCTVSGRPYPPFRLGTPGHVSPEQDQCLLPTVEQDVYAIGALLLHILTNLPPNQFVQKDKTVLKEQISFFIPEQNLVDLIVDCFSIDPVSRPTIAVLKNALECFRAKQTVLTFDRISSPVTNHKTENLKFFISRAIAGLVGSSVTNEKKFWVSRGAVTDGADPDLVKPSAIDESLCEGISGMVWLLSRARRLGFGADVAKETYEMAVDHVLSNDRRNRVEVPGGFYSGTAGWSIAISTGVQSGVIIDSEEIRGRIKGWLENDLLHGCGFFNGLAGQGMALLQTSDLLGEKVTRALIQDRINQLIEQQERDGAWITVTDRNKNLVKPTGFAHGVAGISCFLFCYLQQYGSDSTVEHAVLRGMQWLLKQSFKRGGIIYWPLNEKTRRCSLDFQDGLMGIILSLIKAYQVFEDPLYKEYAFECLNIYPLNPISRQLSLGTGLAGYGEVLLEAAITFKDTELQRRADWIAAFLTHYFMVEEGGGRYWIADGSSFPTASLLGGNSGLIHFLLRYYQPGELSHPLLRC